MKLTITAPATTANLGAGFDVFGAALTWENRFTVEGGEEGFSLTGEGSLSTLGHNLFFAGLEAAADALGQPAPRARVRADAVVPLRSGLGSSATAICAGMLAGQELLGEALPLDEALRIAARLDGHPDNVAACLLGGATISAGEGIVRRLPAPDLRAVVFYPGMEQGTEAARRGLPLQVDRCDAVFNIGRASLFVYALAHRDYGLLRTACEDRLHEEMRLAGLPFAAKARAAALSAGALAVPVSGSGPSLVALVEPARADEVGAALRDVARDVPTARVIPLAFSERGARAERMA